MKVYDISMPYLIDGAHWPGDISYNYELVADIKKGSSVDVGILTFGVHGGTHIDAPFHYDKDGKTIDMLAVEDLILPVIVIDAIDKKVLNASLLENTDLKDVKGVLFKTLAWKNRSIFPMNIPVISPDLAPYLKANGIKLLGVDLPSVDAIEDSTIKAHKSLGKNNITILEGLVLDDINPGIYELTALPIYLQGSDASPVRAILR